MSFSVGGNLVEVVFDDYDLPEDVLKVMQHVVRLVVQSLRHTIKIVETGAIPNQQEFRNEQKLMRRVTTLREQLVMLGYDFEFGMLEYDQDVMKLPLTVTFIGKPVLH